MAVKRVLLGVTSDVSLKLMRGFPEYLMQSGWDVHVVSSPGDALDELARVADVRVHTIPMKREPSPVADFKALVGWVRLLRSVRPTLIAVGTPKAGLLAMIAGFLARVPRRIYLLRGLRLETTSGLRRLVFLALEALAAMCSHKVVAVSDSLRSEAIRLRIVPARKILVLGGGSSNGVDLECFQRSRFTDAQIDAARMDVGLVEGVPVLGFVGRLHDDKGLRVLAEARSRLSDAGVDHQLLLVGGVERNGDNLLEQLFASGRLPVVTGHVDDPAVYYRLMDVLCLPTLREGFPNVVLEAAASGVPTVTTDATGAVDSVIHGETGLIASVGSAASLAASLAEILLDQTMRTKMGQSAKAWVSVNYRRGDNHQRTQEFYLTEIAAARTFDEPRRRETT